MQKPLIAILLLAGVILLRADAFACSCMSVGGPACQRVWEQGNTAAFLGRVTNIEATPTRPPSSFLRVTFAVEESYIGAKGKTVDVFTAGSEAGCGYSFTMGGRYIVYTYTERNELHTDLCSGTRSAQGADEDIAYLRSIPNRSIGSRVYGDLKRYSYDPLFQRNFQPSLMDHQRPSEETYRSMLPMMGSVIRIKIGGKTYETVADRFGKWQFNDVPAGNYELSVNLPPTMILDPNFRIRGELAPKGCSLVNLRAESNGHMMGTLRSSRPLRSPNLPQVVIFTAGSRVVDALRPDWSFFPDENGNFDLAPLPPGKYYLATLLYNGDLDVGLVFYPGTGDPRKAAVIELGEGEQKQGMDFTVGTPRFHKRKTCCEFKIKLGP